MAYSYTEKKRIRKDFGMLPKVMDVPYLLAIQMDSYSKFTQQGLPPEDAVTTGCMPRLSPFSRLSATAAMRTGIRGLQLGTPVFDVNECQLRGCDLFLLPAGKGSPDHLRQGIVQQDN